MELHKLEIGKHYTKTSAYTGRTWFEVKCINVDIEKEKAIFERIKCLDDDPYRGGAGLGMTFDFNKIECKLYIHE